MGDLSEHFDSSEFACQCGCGYGTNPGDVSEALLEILEDIREIIMRPIIITSGCRCRYHNRVVNGAVHSRHVTGEAADIGVLGGRERHDVLTAAAEYAWGIGVAKSFIHIDCHIGSPDCPRPAAWSY